MNMNIYSQKVVVITGAGSGIGRALAQQLAAKGARLALSDINKDGLDETIRLLPVRSDIRSYIVDVSKKEEMFTHAQDVERDFGAVHIVFNNAGASITGTIAHLDIEELEWQVNVNLWSVIYGTKAFLPGMLSQREGSIVNISSVFGLLTYPTQGAYNIAKFGVRALTEVLWSELKGTGVRAVCVHPGGIKTNIERGGRRCKASGSEEADVMASVDRLLLTPPEDCAADILAGVARGRKRIITGNKSTTMWWLGRLLPNHYHPILKLFG